MEVLLIDDGSDSYCQEICLEYSDNSLIKYYRQDNQGVSVARNLGLSIATGEYIVFVDADDKLPDLFLEKIMPLIPNSRPDIVMFGYISEYSNRLLERHIKRNTIPELDSSTIIESILDSKKVFRPYDVGTIWSKLIKRKLITDNRIQFPIGIKKGQDTVFMLYVYSYSNRISYVDTVGYYYRKNNQSVTHKLNPEIVNINEALIAQYSLFLSMSKINNRTECIINNIRLNMLLGEYLSLYFCHKNNPKKKTDLQEEYKKLINTEPYRHAIGKTEKRGFIKRLKVWLLRKEKVQVIWLIKTIEDFGKMLVMQEYE